MNSGVLLAADHAQAALSRAVQADAASVKRLGATIEAVWWLGAGWDGLDGPQGEELLHGFWWMRNRSIHDVEILVRRFGGYAEGYSGAPPLVTKITDTYQDTYVDEYATEVWGSRGEIEPTQTRRDRTKIEARDAYDQFLAGKSIFDTIGDGLARLRKLAS